MSAVATTSDAYLNMRLDDRQLRDAANRRLSTPPSFDSALSMDGWASQVRIPQPARLPRLDGKRWRK